MVSDEGCPRAAGAARAPLRRSAPRVLRWKTLRVSSAPHPCGFESHAPGTKDDMRKPLGAASPAAQLLSAGSGCHNGL